MVCAVASLGTNHAKPFGPELQVKQMLALIRAMPLQARQRHALRGLDHQRRLEPVAVVLRLNPHRPAREIGVGRVRVPVRHPDQPASGMAGAVLAGHNQAHPAFPVRHQVFNRLPAGAVVVVVLEVRYLAEGVVAVALKSQCRHFRFLRSKRRANPAVNATVGQLRCPPSRYLCR